MSLEIYPSILSADFSKLGQEVIDVIDSGADGIHVDCMDGHFVPNLTFGAPVLKSISSLKKVPFDCHLMVTRPDDLIEDFIKAGATGITFHSEVVHHLQRSLRRIKDAGLKAGVAVNPATDFAHLEWVLDDLDLILSMTVNPGFGGQSLIPAALEKTKRIDQFLKEKSVREKIKIQIDGGANKETAREAKKAGVDILVAGSYIFGSDSYSTAIAELKG